MYKTQLSAQVITLYPELFPGPLSASVTGRALDKQLWSLKTIDLKKYGKGRHKKVDDKPISGGPGMILMPDVLDKALLKANSLINNQKKLIVCMSPKGIPLNQKLVKDISLMKNGSMRSMLQQLSGRVYIVNASLRHPIR